MCSPLVVGPPRRGSVGGFVWARVEVGSRPGARWGVVGPLRDIMVSIAGLWVRERFGHVGVRRVVVHLGWRDGGKKLFPRV